VRLGILTGGGDCPGTNGVIRAMVRRVSERHGSPVTGFLDAWDGVMEGRTVSLMSEDVRGILPRGGTILGTRRGSPFDHQDGPEHVRRALAEHGLDALVVVGGNGSLTVASMLANDHGLPIVGVPKTIDNDIVGTDECFGFDTALQVATDAIDRLHTTAESHDRIMVIEVMGRDAGWIALHAGIAGSATAIVVPEVEFDIAQVAELVARRHARGRYASVVVVAEGATPLEGTMNVPDRPVDRHGHRVYRGLAAAVAAELSTRTGYEARVTLLGHVQRGGTPTAHDRVLATRLGLAAADLAEAGGFGKMVSVRGPDIGSEPMSLTSGRTRTIDLGLLDGVTAALLG
jgi:6-phosphofructokinase 1